MGRNEEYEHALKLLDYYNQSYSSTCSKPELIDKARRFIRSSNFSRNQHRKCIIKLDLDINRDHFLCDVYREEYRRVTHCFGCGEELDNAIKSECQVCGWILCNCGCCGCNYTPKGGEARVQEEYEHEQEQAPWQTFRGRIISVNENRGDILASIKSALKEGDYKEAFSLAETHKSRDDAELEHLVAKAEALKREAEEKARQALQERIARRVTEISTLQGEKRIQKLIEFMIFNTKEFFPEEIAAIREKFLTLPLHTSPGESNIRKSYIISQWLDALVEGKIAPESEAQKQYVEHIRIVKGQEAE